MEPAAPIVLGSEPRERLTAVQRRARDRAEDQRTQDFWADLRLEDQRRHRIRANRYREYGPPQFDSLIPPVVPTRYPDPDKTLPPGTPIPEVFPMDLVLDRYPSRESAFNHLSSIAVELGFALTKGHVDDEDNGHVYQQYHCHMGPTRGRGANGAAYNGERRCRFFLAVSNNGPGDWFTVAASGTHSHPACRPRGTPSILRVHLAINKPWIKNYVELERPPREVMARLTEQRTPFNRQAVYDLMADLRAELRPERGRFPTNAALKQLAETEDISVPWIDSNGRLEGLLYASKDARVLTQHFGKIFMIDFTFKTNKYNLPCLHIVGKTNANTTFTSALILLPAQTEVAVTEALRAWQEHVLLSTVPATFITDREKALVNAISTVFPDAKHISCQWHITENVRSYAYRSGNLTKEDVDEYIEDWKKHVLHCRDSEKISEGYTWLLRNFGDRPGKRGFRATIHYCKDDLASLQNLFIDATVDLNLHFGNRTTSPAEGNHASLKRWFLEGKPNLSDFLQRARKFMRLQFNKWDTEMALTSSKASRKRHEQLWQFDRTISRFALKEVEKEWKRIYKNDEGQYAVRNACTGYRQTVWLLPCAHEISDRLNNGTWAHYEFDSYWRVLTDADILETQRRAAEYDPQLDRNARERLDHHNLAPVVLDPLVRPGRRLAYRGERMARRLNTTDTQSTRRDLTGPEVDALEAAEREGNMSIIERVDNLASQADSNTASQRQRAQREQSRRARGVRHCRNCRMTGHDRRNCPSLRGEPSRTQPTQPDVVVEVIDGEESPSQWTDFEELIDLTRS